jgi:prevent-host-death family protein
MSEVVGIRELRQYLSRYLERIEHGESFVVTDRNRPVARLMPLAEATPDLARLVADGRLIPPSRSRLDFSPVRLRGRAHLGTEALEYVRGERG